METIGADANTIGRYRVLGRLAKGGMAEVLIGALDGAAGVSRAVVIKRVLPHLAEESEFRTMFLDEAKLVAGLRHPNVVSVLELGEDDGLLFLVMEYLQGEGLDALSARVLNHGTVLEPRLAAFIVAEACAGLHAAHTHTGPSGEPLNIIHRDVSPHNIFLGYDGHVKLIDFGIAQSNIQDSRTQTGIVKGKISYMAPEQLDRRPLDHRVDVFALGIVLWELLTGQRLFKRQSPMETVRAVCFDPIPGPLDVRDDLPVYLDGICRCALSRDPNQRYESAAAMREDLLKCIRSLNQTGNERDELARLLQQEFAENRKDKRRMIRSIESGGDADVSITVSSQSLTPPSQSGTRIPTPQTPSETPARSETPAWRKQALLFGVIAVATFVTALVLTSPTPVHIAKTPPAEAPAPVVLRLTSTPPGAAVEVEGEARGRTPIDLTLAYGTAEQTLTLTLDGHETASRMFVPDSALRMEVALVEIVESEPVVRDAVVRDALVREPVVRDAVVRETRASSSTMSREGPPAPSMVEPTSMRIFRVD